MKLPKGSHSEPFFHELGRARAMDSSTTPVNFPSSPQRTGPCVQTQYLWCHFLGIMPRETSAEVLLRMIMEHLPRLPDGADPDKEGEVPHIVYLFAWLMAEVHGWANVYRARYPPNLFANMSDGEVIIRGHGLGHNAQRSERVCHSCPETPVDALQQFWKG